MANNYNTDQRKWIIKQHWKLENAEQVFIARQEAIHTHPPSHMAIYRIMDKFETPGSVCNAKKSGCPKTSMAEENEMLVAETFVNSASQKLSIPRISLQHIMDKLDLKPYHTQQIHGLLEDNPDRWLRFCQSICAHIINEQPEILDKIIWSDESYFKLSAHVNRHNCVHWADKNPHLTIESQLNKPGITMWVHYLAKVSSDLRSLTEQLLETIIGKFFLTRQYHNTETKLTLTNRTSSKMEHIYIMRGQ